MSPKIHSPCVFCYKNATCGNRELVCRFAKLSQRFCSPVTTLWNALETEWNCCEGCAVLVSSFCSVYNQLKCLELRLEWSLDKLISIMKLANKVPLRVSGVRKHFERCGFQLESVDLENSCQNRLETFKCFRKSLMRGVGQRLRRSYPRVLLQPLITEKTKVLPKAETDHEQNTEEYLLGLTATFAAVIMLACYSAPFTLPSGILTNMTIQEISDEDEEINCDFAEDTEPTVELDAGSMAPNANSLDHVGISNNSQDNRLSSSISTESDVRNDFSFTVNNSGESLERCKTEPIIKSEPTPEQSQSRDLFSCKICSKQYQREHALRQHNYKMHLKKQNYPCKVCKRVCASYQELRCHKLQPYHRLMRTISLNTGNTKNKSAQMSENEQATVQKSTKRTPIQAEDLQSSKFAASSSEPRYKLRTNRKRNYASMEQNNFSGNESENGYSTDSTSSSDSEASENLTLSRKRRKNPNYAYCWRDGCKTWFSQGKSHRYFEHRKLHLPGNFKCNFCEFVGENIVKLSLHEEAEHARKFKKKHNSRIYHCARCSYATLFKGVYYKHFAEYHIGGFDWRKGYKNYKFCKICRCHVNFKVDHMNKYHNISGMDDCEVKKCSVSNCEAYFCKQDQLWEHQGKVHQIVSSTLSLAEEDIISNIEVFEKDQANRLKCKLCKKVYRSLQNCINHIKIYHKQKSLANKLSKYRRKYICPISNCSERYITKKDLQIHQTHHGSFKCNFCNVSKDYAPDLAVHESSHEFRIKPKKRYEMKYPEKTLYCPRCPSRHDTNKSYISHHLKVHLGLELITISCEVCNAQFITAYGLHIHKQVNHSKENSSTTETLNCDLCSAYFTNTRGLVKHKSKSHWSSKCPDCGESFAQFENKHARLRLHIEQHHPDHLPQLKFHCGLETCWRRFATQTELDKHKEKNDCETSSVECFQCNKTFRDGFALKKHIINVHAARAYICEICGKGFKTKGTLTAHMDYHHNGPQSGTWQCSQCGKAFATLHTLEQHLEFHKNPDEWKFQCSTCDRKFASKQKLTQHGRTHTKEKPFVCQFCGAKYAHRHNWRNHMKTKHPGDFTEETRKLEGVYLSRKGSKRGDCILAGTSQK